MRTRSDLAEPAWSDFCLHQLWLGVKPGLKCFHFAEIREQVSIVIINIILILIIILIMINVILITIKIILIRISAYDQPHFNHHHAQLEAKRSAAESKISAEKSAKEAAEGLHTQLVDQKVELIFYNLCFVSSRTPARP